MLIALLLLISGVTLAADRSASGSANNAKKAMVAKDDNHSLKHKAEKSVKSGAKKKAVHNAEKAALRSLKK
jgi:uncharacterized membrane protein